MSNFQFPDCGDIVSLALCVLAVGIGIGVLATWLVMR